MKLTSFQILNCFGFINSEKVKLDNYNNFIYILGRNSSGKSSLLNCIKYLGKDIKPDQQQNFTNFSINDDMSFFVAEFSLKENKIGYSLFKKDFYNYLATQGIDTGAFSHDAKIKSVFEKIEEYYKRIIEEVNSEEIVVVTKFSSGNYYFASSSNTQEAYSRRDEINSLIKGISNAESQIIVYGSWRRVNITANILENLIFNQFPKIYLFNEQFSLKDSLPNKITSDWEKKGSKFEKQFVEYLGKEKIDRILETNNPRERRKIENEINEKVRELLDKVNSNITSNNNQDLLDMFLDISTEGIQITLYTDEKESFYSHLSDNTKFLFAYHLYQTTANISGNILLFDEPNNGFHPTAQRTLLHFLQKLALDGNLVIVSTHSEHLIDTDYLSSIRLMSADSDKNITVKNHFYTQPKEKGDYLALQPIFDAIGYKYGKQLGSSDNVIITEGITDLLYLRTFNKILKIVDVLDIAPARGDSTMLQIIPFLISQSINFKIVIDVGNVKDLIKTGFGIDDKFFYEIPIPLGFPKMKGSGIEDLFSKADFKKLLTHIRHSFTPQFSKISNSCYMGISEANKIEKRLLAEDLYKKADSLRETDFESETLDNFRKVLKFCGNSDWFFL